MSDLVRSSRALGRELNFFGSKEKDFVIQTKGRVKINFGDKFIELFNGRNFTVGGSIIKDTNGEPSATDSDGFYFDEDTGTLYLKIGDKIYTIFTNAKENDGFISYTEEQNLTTDEQYLAKTNIGSVYNTPEEAKTKGSNGVVYVKSENKAYILYEGQLYPIINNTEINMGDISGNEYYFDKTVTIDVSDEDIALIIAGLEKHIHIGTEDNSTNIYQTNNGGVIDSDKSLTIKIDGKDTVIIKGGEVDFNAVINAIKGIITDEIYSSNFELNQSGWGIWIDKTTGESYLQVDHILSNVEIIPEYIRYQDAVQLAALGWIEPNTTYVVIDYQNEWEITSIDDEYGTNIVQNTSWSPDDSDHPEQYGEDDVEPKFGVDRNVRPLMLIGKSAHQYESVCTYYYAEDNKDVISMLYDIRVENYDPNIWPTEESEDLLDLTNKGRIYYMKDGWNNEAPCDFKHFKNDEGKWVFNYSDGSEASSLNTNDNIVCSNNRILDVTIRLADKIDPMTMTGKLINNNTLGGTFEDVSIGDPDSIIEYNYFNGVIKRTNFIGTFVNNSIGCTMEDCEFKESVVNNEFNKDVKKCVFNKEVTNNVFDMSFEECNFGKISSNQFTGSAIKCEFYNASKADVEIRENQLMGDFTECKFLGNVFSNDMKVDTVEKCIFEKDFMANQITGELWSENLFKDTLKNNTFQSTVVQLMCEGLMNVNHFMGRVNKVSFFKPASDPVYGINDNVFNGLIEDVECYVDFSHNTLIGPLMTSRFRFGTPGQDNRCLFNYNHITMASAHELNTNHDFRHNTIAADYFNFNTFNGVFSYNTLKYFRIGITTTGLMRYCKGEGLEFLGDFPADVTYSNFCNFNANTLRAEPIAYAHFRSSFSTRNFVDDPNVQDLDLLYDPKHQVDIFYHKDKVVVSCQACASPIKGEIKMFNGLMADIPDGWHVCDGTEGTPDLTDKFIKAGLVAGETGGAENGEITLASENIPDHSHDIELSFDTGSFSSTNVVAGNSIVDFIVDAGGSSNYCLYTGSKGGENYSISNIGSEVASSLDNGTAQITAGGGAAGGGEISPVNIEPPYYTLIFIMKL